MSGWKWLLGRQRLCDFPTRASVFWKLCRGLGAKASTPPKMARDFWKIWTTLRVMICPSPEAAEVQQLQTPLFLEISVFHYLNLEKHKNMNMLSHLSFSFFSPFLLQTHHTDAFRKPRRFLLPVLLHEKYPIKSALTVELNHGLALRKSLTSKKAKSLQFSGARWALMECGALKKLNMVPFYLSL